MLQQNAAQTAPIHKRRARQSSAGSSLSVRRSDAAVRSSTQTLTRSCNFLPLSELSCQTTPHTTTIKGDRHAQTAKDAGRSVSRHAERHLLRREEAGGHATQDG